MPQIPISERLAVLTGNEGWFGRAPKDFQDALLSRCEWLARTAGQPIYQAADQQADLLGVADGAIEIYSRFGAGDNPLLHIGYEGLWVGYGSFLSGQRPRVTVVARIDTLLARVPRRVVLEQLAQHPDGWRILANAALEYGDMAISAYADSLIPDNARRCACTLLRIAGLQHPRRSRPERTDVLVTQDELATMVNVSRTTLVQVLQGLERRGLIEQGYRALRVVDVAGLTAVASGQ